MPFQESAESLRSKLHVGRVPIPVLVGSSLALIFFCALAGFMVWNSLSSQTFAISSDDAVEDGSSEVSRDSSMESSFEAQRIVLVHVSGAVASPGVYELPEASRVNEAVEKAGGFTAEAATDAINLARVVTDGEQIVVPSLEEWDKQQMGELSISGSATGKVNINTATVEQLDSLPGIGEATAEKIIEDREQNGPFSSPEDLQRVSGIGEKKYAELADLISIG